MRFRPQAGKSEEGEEEEKEEEEGGRWSPL